MDHFRTDRNHPTVLVLFLSNLKVPEVHRRFVPVYKAEARYENRICIRFGKFENRDFSLTMLPPLGCLYGGLSMACTTGNFWTMGKLSRPSTTLPNCKRSGPRSISHGSNATECTTSTITPIPHVAKTTKSLLKTSSWTVLSHPSYSPDLVPTDYYLVPDMQQSFE
uniref:Uncharacterized protein n=1 Tax=Caenorhabditis japonica TaxID=281687 RepID=A0A8R1IT44_CAEJA